MQSRRNFLRSGAVAALGFLPPIRASGADPASQAILQSFDFGLGPDRTPTENRLALARAIASVPAGGALCISDPTGRPLRIEASRDVGGALQIGRPMTISIDTHMIATAPGGPNCGSHLFSVSGDDIVFEGNGRIEGGGEPDAQNNGDDANYSSLIHVTGNRFRFSGITVHNVPKVGIYLWGCRDASISAVWRGGIATYRKGQTGLFGIRATGGGGHSIVNNRFECDGDGRRLITAYFAGGLLGSTRGDIVRGNFANVHEKLAYLYTSQSIVQDNVVHDAQQTDIVRIVGNENTVDNLHGLRIKGGVSILGGRNNAIRNCVFDDVSQAGIYISNEHGGTAEATAINDNTIRASASGYGLQDGIYFYLVEGRSGGFQIFRNRVIATKPATWRSGIRMVAAPPSTVLGPFIEDNFIDGAVDGISLRRVSGDIVGGNVCKSVSRAAILRITS